ncbi:PIN domain-containing protein [Halobacteria archaeon AArc-xg1-1]|uniref:PIN domain-containing protein n=1 Tax=Natronoglomus mannanivorans TaxID=2979990 RepID=A0AAP2Z2Z2_9EURY|nr:PIN domain-containing protein [Halobacteria archaeon AArc-xg1-1]
MKLFLDTNVIVAAVTQDTERSETAVRVLNDFDETYTSILNLMELRSIQRMYSAATFRILYRLDRSRCSLRTRIRVVRNRG